MLRRPGFHLPGNAIQAFLQKRTERPSGAVAGQHIEIVDMKLAIPVSEPNLRRVDRIQPVVRDDFP